MATQQNVPSSVFPSFMSGVPPQKSPYYVNPETMTPLQKHCAFFDRNGDGLVMPWETFEGFRVLGYNLFLAILGTIVVHFFFSYWTLDSWIPDPFFAILIKNVHRLKHASDSEVYEHDGTLKPMQEPVVTMLSRYDQQKRGGLSYIDLWRMTQHKWDVLDIFGWVAGKLEWFYLWVLSQQNGVVPFDDIKKSYDDTLFKQVEHQRRQAGLVK